MKRAGGIPERTKKLVIQEAGGVCAFCEEAEVSTLEFHHIEGRDGPDPHHAENLLYVCKNCHGTITAGKISKAQVTWKKRTLGYAANLRSRSSPEHRTVHMSGGVNKGIIANEVHYHARGRKPLPVSPPEGAISSDLLKRNYAKHLIDRYHEFARAHHGEGFRFAALYQAIKRKFGAKWDMMPLGRFGELCAYLQERINATRLGKTRKAHGEPNYSSFDDYCVKYAGRQ